MEKLSILVVTRHKWSSRLRKHNEIKKLMMQGGFKDIRFTTVHDDLGLPKVTKGKIDPVWFEENVSKRAKREDYNFVIFQFSEREGKNWKLEDGIRGQNIPDHDFYGEAWVCSDEKSIVKFKDGVKVDKYTKVVPHEIAHELKRQDYTDLEIHDYDHKNDKHNIAIFYKDLGTEITLLDKIRVLKAQLLNTRFPLFDKEYRITQVFGASDPVTYPRTGVHIGTDFATPKVTPIFAPLDGKLTSITAPETGLTLTLETAGGTYQFLHCEYAYPDGAYKRGDRIGYTGNSGSKTTGPHCCVRLWKCKPDISKLSKTNVYDYLEDVTKK